jgi:hypothetical protein
VLRQFSRIGSSSYGLGGGRINTVFSDLFMRPLDLIYVGYSVKARLSAINFDGFCCLENLEYLLYQLPISLHNRRLTLHETMQVVFPQ